MRGPARRGRLPLAPRRAAGSRLRAERLARRIPLLPLLPPRGARVVVSRLQTGCCARACAPHAGRPWPAGWDPRAAGTRPGRTRGRPPSKCRLRRSFRRSTSCVASPTPAPKWAAGDSPSLRGQAGGPPPGARARGGTRHGMQFQTQFIPEKYDTRISFSPGFSTLNHRGIIRYDLHFIACVRCTTIAQRAFRNRVFKRGIWSV